MDASAASQDSAPLVLAADIGKSKCRLELRESHRTGAKVLASTETAGFAGLATAEGVNQALALISDATTRLPIATGLRIGAAVAGVAADPVGARRLAAALAAHFGAEATVLSDATAAHLGAFGSAPGTVLIVGTGAVAFRFDADGKLHRADGWGPFLGDRGSGRWIGQQGLSAVLEAHDAGPNTALTAASAAMVSSPELLPAWLGTFANPAKALASFAPMVLAAAQNNDKVAAGIIAQACEHLADSAERAAGSATPPERVPEEVSVLRSVAVVGGLAQSDYFASTLAEHLERRGLQVVAPLGSGLDGAALAAGPEPLLQTGEPVQTSAPEQTAPLLQERYLYRESAK